MDDYFDRLYEADRDQRVGFIIKSAGEHTETFSDLLPERAYTLCLYL